MCQTDGIVFVEMEFLVKQLREFRSANGIRRFVDLGRVKRETTKVWNNDHGATGETRFGGKSDLESPDTGVVIHASGEHA